MFEVIINSIEIRLYVNTLIYILEIRYSIRCMLFITINCGFRSSRALAATRRDNDIHWNHCVKKKPFKWVGRNGKKNHYISFFRFRTFQLRLPVCLPWNVLQYTIRTCITDWSPTQAHSKQHIFSLAPWAPLPHYRHIVIDGIPILLSFWCNVIVDLAHCTRWHPANQEMFEWHEACLSHHMEM